MRARDLTVDVGVRRRESEAGGLDDDVEGEGRAGGLAVDVDGEGPGRVT